VTHRGRRQIRLSRDILIFGIAAGLLIYEVTLGGARPDVLTVCVSLLLTPGVLRIDEARRRDDEDDN
jgi:hypothetical protein